VTLDETMMGLALEEARLGLEAGCMPIGAVLAHDDRVLASAHWRGSGEAMLAHPELLVLTEADSAISWNTRRASALYTTLEPCLMCMGAAMSFFAARVVFALRAPADGASLVSDLWAPTHGHPSGTGSYALPKVVGGILARESRQLIEQWLAGGAEGPEAEFARRTLAHA
jgi:tRNA(adenine34) deaminase